jgi:hypothetical protein
VAARPAGPGGAARQGVAGALGQGSRAPLRQGFRVALGQRVRVPPGQWLGAALRQWLAGQWLAGQWLAGQRVGAAAGQRVGAALWQWVTRERVGAAAGQSVGAALWQCVSGERVCGTPEHWLRHSWRQCLRAALLEWLRLPLRQWLSAAPWQWLALLWLLAAVVCAALRQWLALGEYVIAPLRPRFPPGQRLRPALRQLLRGLVRFRHAPVSYALFTRPDPGSEMFGAEAARHQDGFLPGSRVPPAVSGINELESVC